MMLNADVRKGGRGFDQMRTLADRREGVGKEVFCGRPLWTTPMLVNAIEESVNVN